MNQKPDSEPPDHHTYNFVWLFKETVHFFLSSVKFYISLIENDIKEIESDIYLKELIREEDKKSLQIYREHSKAKRTEEWLKKYFDSIGPDGFDCEISMTHGTVRFIKTTAILYLKHLKKIRNKLSAKQNISRYALETVDNRISSLEENINKGVFENATSIPLLLDEVIDNKIKEKADEPRDKLTKVERPRPVVIHSIQILDPELRERCLDLYDAFYKDGKHERFDTVISEATRIFETRLRSLSGASAECVGIDLAKVAFGTDTPVLHVSEVNSEQEAVHLLFRGAFGFVRNPVQHKLLGKLSPDRVLQILGFIDYLIYVAENAKCEKT